jgi:hypothetical protein
MHLQTLLAAPAPSPEIILGPVLQTLGKHWPLWLGVAVIIIVSSVLRLPVVKGMMGEGIVRRALSRLDRERYRVLHNVFVPSRTCEGGMTEIDHVVVSAYGIFVIETKHYGGWIFGNPADLKWTRTGRGCKRTFLNPLKQNQGHLYALACFLMLPRAACHSVVCFTGDAAFKTPMPPNVITTGLVAFIESKRETLLEDEEVATIWSRLTENDAGMDKRRVRREHVASLSSGRG